MKIEEIFTEYEKITADMLHREGLARTAAKKALKKGNKKKWDKFNAVARVYHMGWIKIDQLNWELLKHAPVEFQNKEHLMPF
jgi:hypothetical protein